MKNRFSSLFRTSIPPSNQLGLEQFRELKQTASEALQQIELKGSFPAVLDSLIGAAAARMSLDKRSTSNDLDEAKTSVRRFADLLKQHAQLLGHPQIIDDETYSLTLHNQKLLNRELWPVWPPIDTQLPRFRGGMSLIIAAAALFLAILFGFFAFHTGASSDSGFLFNPDCLITGLFFIVAGAAALIVGNWEAIFNHPTALITVLLSCAGAAGGLAFHLTFNDKMIRVAQAADGWIEEHNVREFNSDTAGESDAGQRSKQEFTDSSKHLSRRQWHFITLGFLADVLIGIVAANAVHLFLSGLINYDDNRVSPRAQLSFIALGVLAGYLGPQLLDQQASQLALAVARDAANKANAAQAAADNATVRVAEETAHTTAAVTSVVNAVRATVGDSNLLSFLTYSKNPENSDAIALFKPADASATPATLQDRLRKGFYFYLQGNWSESENALGTPPGSSDDSSLSWAYYTLLGRVAGRQGDLKKADKAFDEARALGDPLQKIVTDIDRNFLGAAGDQKTSSKILKNPAEIEGIPSDSRIRDLAWLGRAREGLASNDPAMVVDSLGMISKNDVFQVARAWGLVTPDVLNGFLAPANASGLKLEIRSALETVAATPTPVPTPDPAPSVSPDPAVAIPPATPQ